MQKYLNYFLYAILITLIIGLYFFMYYSFYQEKDFSSEIITYTEKTQEEIINNTIFCEIKGAIENPGVYELNSNSIINDLVTLSGGFKSNAYTNNINLAKKVSNEMVLYVYTKYEYSKLAEEKVQTVYVEKECNCPTYDITKCTDTGNSIINTKDEPINEQIQENNNLININTASISELTSLSGIGEAKAKSIITYREENGNFKDIKDITNVSGISDSMYEKIKDYITV